MLCDNCVSNKHVSTMASYCKDESSYMNTLLLEKLKLTSNVFFYYNDSVPFDCDQYIPKPKFENRITSLT